MDGQHSPMELLLQPKTVEEFCKSVSARSATNQFTIFGYDNLIFMVASQDHQSSKHRSSEHREVLTHHKVGQLFHLITELSQCLKYRTVSHVDKHSTTEQYQQPWKLSYIFITQYLVFHISQAWGYHHYLSFKVILPSITVLRKFKSMDSSVCVITKLGFIQSP